MGLDSEASEALEVRRLKADLEAAKNELEPLEEHLWRRSG